MCAWRCMGAPYLDRDRTEGRAGKSVVAAESGTAQCAVRLCICATVYIATLKRDIASAPTWLSRVRHRVRPKRGPGGIQHATMATTRPPGACPLIGRFCFSTYTPTCSFSSTRLPDYHLVSRTQWPNLNDPSTLQKTAKRFFVKPLSASRSKFSEFSFAFSLSTTHHDHF